MIDPSLAIDLPLLPLVLWRTPPGLAQILDQEGVPYVAPRELNHLSLQVGRFVVVDGRRDSLQRARALLTPRHVLIDAHQLRKGEPRDPFEALIESRTMLAGWDLGDVVVRERIARSPRAAIRQRVIDQLRALIQRGGGTWARVSPYPFPYRSAFNLRVDLDEPRPDDYFRFAHDRRPLSDCTTHFVSTAAYGAEPAVLTDLARFDSQSHGHHHTVYRDEVENRRNLQRAHAVLAEAGICATGFAAPHGRWNAGLDRAVAHMGYTYSSEFQLGCDDLPFYPFSDEGFSPVLQVPVHPVCEGLFLEAGRSSARRIADHYVRAVHARLQQGLPAFVYGHPERRLARMPEILAGLADAVKGEPLLWRVTMTGFARWWRWRAQRRATLFPRSAGRVELVIDAWDGAHPLALDIYQGKHFCRLPITGARSAIGLDELAYVRPPHRVDLPEPRALPVPWSLRNWTRNALDWETATPIAELSGRGPRGWVKKSLRTWRAQRGKPSC